MHLARCTGADTSHIPGCLRRRKESWPSTRVHAHDVRVPACTCSLYIVSKERSWIHRATLLHELSAGYAIWYVASFPPGVA